MERIARGSPLEGFGPPWASGPHFLHVPPPGGVWSGEGSRGGSDKHDRADPGPGSEGLSFAWSLGDPRPWSVTLAHAAAPVAPSEQGCTRALRLDDAADGASALLSPPIDLSWIPSMLTARLTRGTPWDDEIVIDAPFERIHARGGDDTVQVNGPGGFVRLGRGDDVLVLSELVERAAGGGGEDELVFRFDAGEVDVLFRNGKTLFFDRFSGEKMITRGFERFRFEDRDYTAEEVAQLFGEGATPHIRVGGGTQTVTINDTDPTVSVIWDRVVQQAVIDTGAGTGPTVASRAYAMVHTAIYDAWASYDAKAVRVSFDLEGDDLAGRGGAAQKAKAMSFAALTVLEALFPDQHDLFAEVMEGRFGHATEDDGSLAARIGIDAAEDLLALRAGDGANHAGAYADTTGYTPFNPSSAEINDITRWTPENVPIDPEGGAPDQVFLTPHWRQVESFAIAEHADGRTDFSATLPPPPQPFFTEAFSDARLNFDAKTITLGSDAVIGGTPHAAGDEIAVSQALIGEVIDAGFIAQAMAVIDYSAKLTDEGKIIAEFWEDGGGTAYPPGTFMAFAHFVSARDDHGIDDDATLFLAMSNAMLDAGIATWQAKVHYDYVRPVRAIRDLGELGLIGAPGVDENTGETGHVIEAFGGFDADGTGRGTQTILAENFIPFQRPGADPSPPFGEYTSGHSAFSAAGAAVLRQFTGSDAFGASVTFAPDTIQFEAGVPSEEVVLAWESFTAAADEAGLSRLYGGIHFPEGDLNGRLLGEHAGTSAFDLAMSFAEGTVTDADRPFYGDDLLV